MDYKEEEYMNNPQLEEFTGENVIFHYCKLNTALEKILYNRKLKFSQRLSSIDPIENTKISLGHDDYENAYTNDIRLLENHIYRLQKNVKQLCFCKNSPSQLGYLKPRMWDQYGDKYNGVCLAFSKKDIAKIAECSGDIAYDVTYGCPSLPLAIEISINDLKSNGLENYKKILTEEFAKKMLRKHEDYRGEEEFRLMFFSDAEEECIDIADSLLGIIVPDKHKNVYSPLLKEYENIYGYETTYVPFHSCNVFPYKESNMMERSYLAGHLL